MVLSIGDGLEQEKLRSHFVHLRSQHSGAIPLLLLPPFPLTNLSFPIEMLLQPLIDPADSKLSQQPFHVVVPSLPGLGFSDAFATLAGEGFGYLDKTASLLDQLMRRLGYDNYIVSSTGSGTESPAGVDYYIPRLLALRYPSSCVGVHFIDPLSTRPRIFNGIVNWAKFNLAKFFGVESFGYTKQDWLALTKPERKRPWKAVDIEQQINSVSSVRSNYSTSILGLNSSSGILSLTQPNTLSYSLCDSPVGLLSFVLAAVHRTRPKQQLSKEQLIDFTQLAWLPGPEGGMRFWGAAEAEVRGREFKKLSEKRLMAMTAVSTFLGEGAEDSGSGNQEELGYRPPTWMSKICNLVSTRRWEGRGGLLVWDRPEVVIEGVRGLAKYLVGCETGKRLGWTVIDQSNTRTAGGGLIVAIPEDGEAVDLMDEDEDDADSPDTVVLRSR